MLAKIIDAYAGLSRTCVPSCRSLGPGELQCPLDGWSKNCIGFCLRSCMTKKFAECVHVPPRKSLAFRGAWRIAKVYLILLKDPQGNPLPAGHMRRILAESALTDQRTSTKEKKTWTDKPSVTCAGRRLESPVKRLTGKTATQRIGSEKSEKPQDRQKTPDKQDQACTYGRILGMRSFKNHDKLRPDTHSPVSRQHGSISRLRFIFAPPGAAASPNALRQGVQDQDPVDQGAYSRAKATPSQLLARGSADPQQGDPVQTAAPAETQAPQQAVESDCQAEGEKGLSRKRIFRLAWGLPL